MVGLTGLILGSLAASLVSTLISGATSIYNVNAQKEMNQANLENQTAINQANIDASKEFAQNQVQWKVDDMRAAGLNPVLAAGGFGGSSSPTAMQATQQRAPTLDASGIAHAITAMNNTMLTSYLMSQRNDVLAEKNDVLRDLYQRKGSFMDSAKQSPYIGNAKQIMSAADDDQWEAIMKALNDMPSKYNWKK